MIRRQKWSRRKIAVMVVIGIPMLLLLWMIEEALFGHPERVTVWSCTACLKEQPAECGVYESNDFDAAYDEERARSNAWWKLCNKLVAKDPGAFWSVVCNDLDERIDVTCSSRKTWQHEGGTLFRVPVH